MVDDISRRAVLAGLAAAPVAAAPARALTTAEAEALVDRLVAEINTVINSGRSERQMYDEFERIFREYADVRVIARSAMGVPWRSATPDQREAFVDAFRGYIARKYGSRFREFIGGRLEVESARAVKSFHEVKATAFLRNEEPFRVTFLVSDEGGRDQFFNLYIEGVNMLATERTEIGAMLDSRGGDIDTLIRDLRAAG